MIRGERIKDYSNWSNWTETISVDHLTNYRFGERTSDSFLPGYPQMSYVFIKNRLINKVEGPDQVYSNQDGGD